MGQSIDIARYPSVFFDIAKALETKREIAIPNLKKTEAHNMRFKLYGFRKALKANGMLGSYTHFASCEIKIEAAKPPAQAAVGSAVDNFSLTIRSADETGIAQALAQALSSLSFDPTIAIPQPAETKQPESPTAPASMEELIANRFKT